MCDRLDTQLAKRDRQLVVAVDHVGEPETLDSAAVFEQFEPFRSSISCLAVGRSKPADTAIADRQAIKRVHVEPYTQHTLIEVLTSRVADGRLRSATTAEGIKQIATWADGDAHDALAALFGAAVNVGADAETQIGESALATGMATVPQRVSPLVA